MNCDICGKKDVLYHAEIEGSKLVACSSCASHGTKLGKVLVEIDSGSEKSSFKSVSKSKSKLPKAEESVILVVSNYNVLIKNKRERLGLKQEDLAKAINEKESLLQQIESKKIEPPISVAKKLESFLKIKILELYKDPVAQSKQVKESGPLTLGDMINIKTRRRK
ncbi:MAG: multiprotein bridging factor aMBF1 [Candidatus Woesearchaeota archaeon]